LFDPDVLFNKQADFLNEDVHASHRKEPNDRVSHCDSHFGYATKIGQDSPRFDGGRSQRSSHGQDGITRMPRASYSEPNWADKHYTANGSDIRSQQQQTQNSGFHEVLTANHSSKSNGSGPTVNESAKVNHNTCNASALLQQTKEKVDQLVVEKNHDLHRQSNLPTRGSQENVPIRAGIDVTESVTAVKQTAASYSVSTPITSNSQPVEPQSTKKSLGSTDSITSGSGSFTDEADSSVGTSGQSVIKEGTRSPLKSSTKLDQGESKFTRLSKFRKASKSGRCASVNVDVDGSSTVTVNAENNSPSMVRSQSVTDEADGKTRVTKTRARKRPPIFVGTPFNFNCNIVDNSDSLISSTDSKNDACPQDACGDNLKESIVVSSVTNTLSSSVTDCGASTMSEVPEIISELTSRLGTSSAVQSACTVQQDGETLLNTESSQTNDPVHSDLEKKDGLLERSSAAVGESVNVNQLWSQFPDNADEEVCAALGELDAVMMAACDEMQIVDEADITGDVSIQSNSGPCLDDDAVFLSSPRHIPGDAAVEDEKHLTDGVCSELLFSDPIDHNGSSQQPEKAGQLSENEVECHVNGDRVIKKSESDTDAIVNKDTDAEIQSGDIVIGACEEHLSQQQQMESSDCLDGNSKTYFKCDDRVNEDDAVFLENVTNGSKFRSETSETSDQGVKIDRNETSRVINGNCNGGTDDDPVGCDGSFITPTGVVTLFDGSLAITDSGAGCLCLCGHTGIVEHRVTGLKPFSVAVSGHDEQQSIFVGDRRRKTVAIFDRHGSDVAQWPENQLDWVCGITVLPNGDLAILDRSHVRQLGIYSSGGDLLAELGGHGGSANDLCMAEFLAIDSRGRIIVADSGNHCIKAFDPRSGASPVARFGSRGCGHGQLQWPKGVAVDAADNVLVADSRNGRVLMFSSDGQLLGTVVSSIRAPYAVCSVSTKSVAVTTYSVTGPSEFHLYDVST
jgi:tripartite motif-containing protein 2/3